MNKKLQVYPQILILFILCFILPAGAQTPVPQPPLNSPAGVWERQSDGQQYVISFQPDGTGMLQNNGETSSFKWITTDNTLTMDGDGSQYVFQIIVTPETLTMTDKKTQTPVVWYRMNEQKITGLAGTWKNSESVFQFNPDGIAIIAGERYKYAINGNIITLTGYDGSMLIPFTLNGDLLNLTVNGKCIIFNRSLP